MRNFRLALKTGVFLSIIIFSALICFGDQAALDPEKKLLTISFIDVKQGDSTLIETPNGKTILIDGGAPAYYDPKKNIYYSRFDAGRDRVLPYLKKRGIKHIDVMIGTHPDADHIGGLVYILKNFDVKSVYYNGKMHTSNIFKEFLSEIDKQNIPYHLARDGDIIKIDESILIQVIHPRERDLSMNSNDTSIVIKLSYGQVSFMLPGDAEIEVEHRLIREYGNQLKSKILKAGHHGSKTATSIEFLRKVRPEVVVISCGYKNKYGMPQPEFTQRFHSLDYYPKFYRTDYQGDIKIETDGENYTVSVSKGPQKEYFMYKVNMNNASPEDLIRILDFPKDKAEKVVSYRKKHKKFNSNEEFKSVLQDDVFYNKIKDKIFIGGAPKPREIKKMVEAAGGKVNVNTASKEELEKLPRIGPKTAQYIIDYRETYGPFETLEDLKKVPRIGKKTLESIRPFVTVE